LLSLAADPLEPLKQRKLSVTAVSILDRFPRSSEDRQNSNQKNEAPKAEEVQGQSERSGNDIVEDVEKDENSDYEDDEEEDVNFTQGGEEEIDLGIPENIWKPLLLTATDGSVTTINRLRDDSDETIREKIFSRTK
jgi:hypothetical protein